MAKSIRSKSKRRFRAIKRQTHFGDVADKRLNQVCARLHKNSKVVEAPQVPTEPERFSFKTLFVDNAIKRQAEAKAIACGKIVEVGDAELLVTLMQSVNCDERAIGSMDIDDTASTAKKLRRRMSRNQIHKATTVRKGARFKTGYRPLTRKSSRKQKA